MHHDNTLMAPETRAANEAHRQDKLRLIRCIEVLMEHAGIPIAETDLERFNWTVIAQKGALHRVDMNPAAVRALLSQYK